MKKRFLSNYYSRLIFISALAIVLVIFTTVSITFLELNREQNEKVVENCDNALAELADGYVDIWNSYYKAFLPIYENAQATKDLQTFCGTEREDVSYVQAFQGFDRIMKAMCQQDWRFSGIYFTRKIDGASYLCLSNSASTQRADMELTAPTVQQGRSILGTRVFQVKPDKQMQRYLFGLQSDLLERDQQEKYQYQVTVLYDAEYFTALLENHDVPADARFYVLSSEGMVLFDSENDYSEEVTYLKDFDVLQASKDDFLRNDVAYLKNSRFVSRGGVYIYYILPKSVLTGFALTGTGSFILVFAASVCLCVLLVLLSMNRAVNKKFAALENGLRRVGKNDLRYRLDEGRHDDEFCRIAVQFNKMCDDLEDTINKNYVFQLLQKNMEYKMLQLRVNPHFLFNSLESIREKLGEDGTEEGAEMVLLLSRIFEYQTRGESIVTVQQERDALEKFIAFSEIRFDHMFEYEIDFEREMLNQVIPKQSLQPILENYFVHGIRGDETDYVSVRGYRKDGKNYICVRDNGKGVSPERAEQINRSLDESIDETAHIGLNNVHNRIKILFGKDSYVRISSNAPEPGTTVLLVFNHEADLQVLEESMGDGKYFG